MIKKDTVRNRKKVTKNSFFTTLRHDKTKFSSANKDIPLLVSDVEIAPRRIDNVPNVDCAEIVRIRHADSNNIKSILQSYRHLVIRVR